MIEICEIFHSIQGEGTLIGMPSVFIRTSGCNLRCRYCDTRYASWEPETVLYELDELVEKTLAFPCCRHVVITGGEPSIAEGIVELTRTLRNAGRHVTMETNGTFFPTGIRVDLASISPKLASSIPHGFPFAERHERMRIDLPAIRSWIEHASDYQMKFVVSGPEDLEEIRAIVGRLDIPSPRVLLMAMGKSIEELREREKWIVSACLHRGYRFTPRLHIYLFEGKKGI